MESQKYKAIVRIQGSHLGKIDEFTTEQPGKGQVLIKVAFAPINPSDISNLKGVYQHNSVSSRIGFEGSGEVVAVGEELVNKV